MQRELDIKMELAGSKEQLEIQEKKYSKMHYMDMQSGEGNQLREYINNLKGRIWALKWVLE